MPKSPKCLCSRSRSVSASTWCDHQVLRVLNGIHIMLDFSSQRMRTTKRNMES
jgi:hypothetical protein